MAVAVVMVGVVGDSNPMMLCHSSMMKVVAMKIATTEGGRGIADIQFVWR